jgi:TetR/AcrR family transcriptional repressor of lmrAB and yxaGH operons
MPAASSRDLMIEAASRLFARQGYKSTTMRGIVEEAGAPWGSVHHHWPGGKEQLGVAAVQFGDQRLRGAMAHCIAKSPTPADAVAMYLAMVAKALEKSGYEEGCPVTTVALEVASDGTAVTEACRAAFDAWKALWTDAFRAAGASPKRSRELGTAVVVALEGALVLSRVSHNTAPLKLAAETVRLIVGREPAATAG